MVSIWFSEYKKVTTMGYEQKLWTEAKKKSYEEKTGKKKNQGEREHEEIRRRK